MTTKVWVIAGATPASCQPASVLTEVLFSIGLSPAWFLQHIIVRDLQSARSTFFLVNDWLSVETESNGGLVEKEVLAASKAIAPAGVKTGQGVAVMVAHCFPAVTLLNLPR